MKKTNNTKHFFLLLALLALIALVTSCASNEYIASSEAFNAGSINISTEKLKSFLSDPSDSAKIPTATLQLGWNYYLTENYKEAMSNFQSVISNYPSSVEAPYASILIAHTHIKEENFGEATEQFNRTYINFRTSVWAEYALYQLARLTFEDYNFRSAIGKYQSLINMYPNSEYSAIAWYDLGESFFKLRDYNQGLSNFKKVLHYTNAAQAPLAAHRMATYYEGRGFLSNTLHYLDIVIDQYPTAPVAIDSLTKKGLILFEQNKLADSEKTFDKLLERYGSTPDAHTASYYLGVIAKTQNNVQKAIENFSAFKVSFLNSIYREEALATLFNLQKTKGENEEAEKTGLILLNDFPDSKSAIQIGLELINSLYVKKDYVKGAEFCEKMFSNPALEGENKRYISQFYILFQEIFLKNNEKAILGYRNYFSTSPPPSFEKLSYIRSFSKLVSEKGTDEDKLLANKLMLDSNAGKSEIASAAYNLATMTKGQKGTDAQKLFREAAQLDPASEAAINSMFELVKLQAETDSIRKAENSARKMVRAYPKSEKSAEALFIVFEKYLFFQDYKKAPIIKELLTTTFPESPWAEKARNIK